MVRKALSPTFTSGKLKGMTAYMGKIVDNMLDHLEAKLQNDPIIDVKQVFQCLSLDTIANCAFGIDINSFQDPENVLFKRSNQAFSDLRFKDMAENVLMHLLNAFPFLFNFLDAYGKENYAFLRDTTKSIVKSRAAPRGDFIDRLKELSEDSTAHGLSEEMIMAQGIGFFIAGFETSSNTMSTLSYHLAMNTQVQDKIYAEICSVMENHNGNIDHESTNEMVYMEAAIEENLRLCPPVTK